LLLVISRQTTTIIIVVESELAQQFDHGDCLMVCWHFSLDYNVVDIFAQGKLATCTQTGAHLGRTRGLSHARDETLAGFSRAHCFLAAVLARAAPKTKRRSRISYRTPSSLLATEGGLIPPKIGRPTSAAYLCNFSLSALELPSEPALVSC